MSAARGSSILIRLFQKITFETAQNTVALDMANRIIKSLDCRKIISIFCILEIYFAISVITLVVIFNEFFQKASVDKSVFVINIVHLIVLSSTKNPLFDDYFNRITALLTLRFSLVMRAYLTSFTLFAVLLLSVMRAYLGPFTLFAVLLLSVMGAYLGPFALFADLLLSVMGAYLGPSALFAGLLLSVMGAYLGPFALFAVRFLSVMRA